MNRILSFSYIASGIRTKQAQNAQMFQNCPDFDSTLNNEPGLNQTDLKKTRDKVTASWWDPTQTTSSIVCEKKVNGRFKSIFIGCEGGKWRKKPIPEELKYIPLYVEECPPVQNMCTEFHSDLNEEPLLDKDEFELIKKSLTGTSAREGENGLIQCEFDRKVNIYIHCQDGYWRKGPKPIDDQYYVDMCPKLAEPVTYISNLEGDLDQLVLSLAGSDWEISWHEDHEFEKDCTSKVIPYGKRACWPKLHMPAKGKFVFGGNLFDFGDGDIRLANMMIRMYKVCEMEELCGTNDKDKGGDKIYFILGNRDINKMRYAVDPQEELDSKKEKSKSMGKKNKSKSMASLRKKQLERSDARYSFNARRAEMELLHLFKNDKLTLNEVARSFQWMTGVDVPKKMKQYAPMAGLYRNYLMLADLIVKIDKTIYTHGAITKDNFMVAPDDHPTKYTKSSLSFETYREVDSAIAGLRRFDDEMIKAWSDAIEQLKPNKTLEAQFPGRPLLTYMKDNKKGVVESSFMKPKSFDLDETLTEAVVESLNKQGIVRVVGGFGSSGPTAAGSNAVTNSNEHVEFLNLSMNFDNLDPSARTIDGRVSKRGGWARLYIDAIDKEATVIGRLPTAISGLDADLRMTKEYKMKARVYSGKDNYRSKEIRALLEDGIDGTLLYNETTNEFEWEKQ